MLRLTDKKGHVLYVLREAITAINPGVDGYADSGEAHCVVLLSSGGWFQVRETAEGVERMCSEAKLEDALRAMVSLKRPSDELRADVRALAAVRHLRDKLRALAAKWKKHADAVEHGGVLRCADELLEALEEPQS